MTKRKPRRSREFRKNNQVVNIEEARRERREKRQKLIEAEAKKRIAEKTPDSSRKKARKNRRRLIYFAIFLVFLAVIGVLAYRIFALTQEKARLETEQERLLMTKDRLEKELESVNSPEYIEQQARSHLRLIRPGETLYILPETKSPEESAAEGAQTRKQDETKAQENNGKQ